MATRRRFLSQATALAATLSGGGGFLRGAEHWSAPLQRAVAGQAGKTVEQTARDESFWQVIRDGFALSPHYVHLDSGLLSPQPAAGVEAVCEQIRSINQQPSWYLRQRSVDDLQDVQRALARFAACSPREILVTRNATESLNIVIMGLPLRAGHEVVFCSQEYGSPKTAVRQRAARDGIIAREFDLPLCAWSDREIVQAYSRAITPRTKLILVSHVIYLTGQIMPVRAICEMAHARGVEVLVDGAHAFAQLPTPLRELQGDYYAASLHKWMLGPIGTGLLQIRRDKIAKIWPLFGDDRYASDSIEKFGHVGTHPVSLRLALHETIRFNQTLGLARKAARLRYLKDYWVSRLRPIPGVIIQTPQEPQRSCAISTFGIRGLDEGTIANRLFIENRIFVVAPGYPGAVRVCPNIFTTTAELDQLVGAVDRLAAS